MIRNFKQLTKSAEHLINTRAHKNRRGAIVLHDYLVSLQLEPIDTGDELRYRDENFVIMKDIHPFLRQKRSNISPESITGRLQDIMIGQDSQSAARSESESTEQED